MLQTEKFNRILILSIFFNFFLYNLSWLMVVFLKSIDFVVKNSFLYSFSYIFVKFISIFFNSLKFLTLIFFIGSIIAIIVVFINDFLINSIKN